MKSSNEWEARFWSKVQQTDTCWLWLKGKTRAGYGVLRINDRTCYAHRLSWELHFGPIPAGMCICHKCDNPTCVNPSHFFLGTRRDNTQDRQSKGRTRTGVSRGEDNGSAKLAEVDVLGIREAVAWGIPQSTVARMFGIGSSQTNRIVHRESWKHV